MKYLKRFNKISDYNNFKKNNNFIAPNISFVNEADGLFFTPDALPYNVAGSLCYYNIKSGKFFFVKYKNINSAAYPLDKYIPIGVLVIPKNHDLYGDYTCTIMSLVNMNPNDPDNGGGATTIPYGFKELITGMSSYRQIAAISDDLNSNNVIKSPGFGYVPTTNIYDYFTGATVSPLEGSGLDTVSRYPAIGKGNFSHSPYLENGERNEMYTCNGEKILVGLTGNCLSDIYGYNNTKILTNKATGQSDWKTADTITLKTTSGYYPSACCCWRYKTIGTKQGDWFLPSAGEIGYLCARLMEVELTLEKVIEEYGENMASGLNMAGNYWTSTSYSDVNGRYLYTGIGGIGHMAKTGTNLVRAFLKL